MASEAAASEIDDTISRTAGLSNASLPKAESTLGISGLDAPPPLVSEWQFTDSEGNVAMALAISSINRDSGMLVVSSYSLGKVRLSWDYGSDGMFIDASDGSKVISFEIIPIKSSPTILPNPEDSYPEQKSSRSSIFHLRSEDSKSSNELSLTITSGRPVNLLNSGGTPRHSEPEVEIDGIPISSKMWEFSPPAKEIAAFSSHLSKNSFTQKQMVLLKTAITSGQRQSIVPLFAVQLISGLSVDNFSSTKEFRMRTPAIQNVASMIGCGLTCLGAGASGVGAALSGGTLSFAMFLAAAGCGTCLGALTAPDLPPPAFIGPGTGGTVGGSLPSLPPGYIWRCETFGADGETVCRPEPEVGFSP